MASLKTMSADKSNGSVKKNDLFRVDPRVMEEDSGFNLRDYNDPDVIEHIQSFADSYSNGRFVPPLIVRVNDDGMIVPVEGHCRRRGALLAISRGADLPYIDCVPFKGSDTERVEVMLRSAEGLPLKPLQVALGYLRLVRMGHTPASIAANMGKSVGRVDNLLSLAVANHDVHELVRSGKVTADAAIEALRVHRGKTGEYLATKYLEAQGKGKGRVTLGVLRGSPLPRKVVITVTTAVADVMAAMDKPTREALALFENKDPSELEGKTIAIDAATLIALVRAQAEIDGVLAKRQASEQRAKQAAAQQTIALES